MSEPATVKVGEFSVPPGHKGFGAIKVGEIADGSSINIPVILINGLQRGPTLYLGAAIHGWEIMGVEIIRRIVMEVDPRRLAGTIIAVPIQNPLAFRAKKRLTPLEEVDMNSIFPGKPDGGLTQRMAHELMEKVVSRANYVVDIHTGVNNYFTILPVSGHAKPEVMTETEELAKALGLKIIIKWKDAGMADVVQSMDIPVVVAELGQNNRLEEKFVNAGVRGITNIMKHLKMIEGRPEFLEEYVISEKRIIIRPSHGGIYVPKVELEDKVSKGDLLATIFNPCSCKEVERLIAPEDGFIARVIPSTVVNEGERIIYLIVPE